MLYLKHANYEDIEKEYLFVRDMPVDENGLTNEWHGISREDFEEKALKSMMDSAKGENLPQGYVPETFLFLWEDETIVGQFRIRHHLCESLRVGAGHIGYFIGREYRDKGYGTEGLRLTLQIAKTIIPEDEVYLRVNEDNPASLHVMLKNGGYIHHEDESKYYVRIRNHKILLFDLDGTLLQSDKTISEHTLEVLRACREKGFLIGVSTSRSEKNSMKFIAELCPDIIISSGGALVKYRDDYIYTAEFTVEETCEMIRIAREICGAECEITIDTIKEHYWNYKIDPNKLDASWGESIYTDFHDFKEKSLKMCVEIFNPDAAAKLAKKLVDCDCVKFSDGEWYKFTKKTATKENAIQRLCETCSISTQEIMAFGDDYVDIGMLKLCGKGVAMGNAIDEVKAAADVVIGNNDEDGIAEYLSEKFT